MQKPVKILQASAGSGKTFSLAAHYLTLLFSGELKYREILAVTFTNKATEEMKSRILEVLLALAKGDDSKKIDTYRQIILKQYPTLNAEGLQQQADVIYRRILHDYSRFSVSTIDGFVQKVIRGFAFELGLDSGYSLEMNIEKVKQDLSGRLEKLLDEKDNLLQWVIQLALSRIANNQSWNYKRELLELSGEVFKDKFKDFELAIGDFGSENVDDVFKKYIDFSENFQKKFEEDLALLAKKAEDIIVESGCEVCDFKGKSRSPLTKFGVIANGGFEYIPKVAKLIDEEENWFQKGKQNILFESLNPLLKEMASIYKVGNGDYILAKAFLKNGYFLRLMQEMAMLLSAYREENETLLFSDAQKLLNGIAEDAGDNPSFIWEKMGNRYRNFLFDEFQDTSGNQWNSFLNLVLNAVSTHNGKLHDHLIVGDAKQSIYRWRDGDYKLLHQKAKADLRELNVFDDQLEENYRSTEEIIKFNNELYPKLAKALQLKINENIPEDDEQLSGFWNTPENQYGTIIESIYKGVEQNSHINTKKGGIVKIHRINLDKTDGSDADLGEVENKKDAALINMILEIKVLLNERGYQQREIGVLVRSNGDAALTVDALMQAGFDVLSGEALKIASNIAIKLIVNVLKLLVVTQSNSALYKANCIALYAQIHGKELNGDDYFLLKKTSLAALHNVLPSAFCENYRQWMQLPIPEMVEKIISAFKLDSYKKGDVNPFLPYLLAFRDLAGKSSKQGEKGISAFLNWWEEEGNSKTLPSPDTANAIQVTTIHKSKGLAFRAVFIPFCDWPLQGMSKATFWVPTANTPYTNLQTIPLSYTSALKGSSVGHHYLEETLFNYMDALNNLYVATTRAKDFIYIGVAGKKSNTITSIGDALLAIYTDELEENNDQVEIGTFSTIGDDLSFVDAITLEGYQTTNRLESIYKATEDRPQKYLDNVARSARRGSNLHYILAEANKVEEVEKVVDKLMLQGLINQEEKTSYIEEASTVLKNPDLSAILTQNANQINEKSIIGVDGKTYRPDKLVLNGNKVSIIDYKFTAEESEHHVAQIKNYQSLIEAMGYDDVKPYLFYASKNKLKAV
ncbi:ATP-dependent helicase/nuclease subunit A [Pedobacter sp. UYP30]|uniref:UvrD-helicase domain-containing protein n=1 Tax=Pedobacter sp. UYP30 TaxID=1756400 RepID=UPI003395573D